MRSYGRGFNTAVDPYAQNGPGPDGLVRCVECDGWFGDLDELRAAGLQAYPEKCRECRAEERAAEGGDDSRSTMVPGAWNAGPRRTASS